MPVAPPRESWGSHKSTDDLLVHSRSPSNNAFSLSPNLLPSRPPTAASPGKAAPSDDLARKSVLWAEQRDSSPVEDADAQMVRQSLFLTKENTGDSEQPLFGSPKEKTAAEPAEIDDSIRVAAKKEEKSPQRTKVMTPSQFEHYRQQKELKASESDASDSGDDLDSESDFDQEDEAERSRLAEKQRRKQEAHLTVYRQQMMKMTGRQSPPLLSLRPDGSPMTNLAPPSPNLGPRTGKDTEGDEDEEIPLGILAAHGFPNKNRPPTRLASPASIPNLRASFQPPFVQQQQQQQQQQPNDSLPAFARNLPRDPYFGASLVNLPNRESLAFGGGSPVNNAAPHPSGLVGVIATEERARATRRADTNTPPNAPSLGVPRPYTMSAPSSTDQAQVQLSQQMTNMMQVQMQMMQHLMYMQGGQSTASLPLTTQRPTSQSPQLHNRSMSTLNPSTMQVAPDYAPSIAPSERSNIGLAPRYRPVSTVPAEHTATKRNTGMTTAPLGQRPLEKTNTNTMVRPRMSYVKHAGGSDDENDDDAAWAEMMRKREKKKTNWKLKRGTTTGDLLGNPH